MKFSEVNAAIDSAFKKMNKAIEEGSPVEAQEFGALIRQLQVIRDDADDDDAASEGRP